jgi:hypothetical protein
MIADDEEADIAELDVITIVALVLSIIFLRKRRRRPVRQHISILTGQHYFNETMQNPNRNNFPNRLDSRHCRQIFATSDNDNCCGEIRGLYL